MAIGSHTPGRPLAGRSRSTNISCEKNFLLSSRSFSHSPSSFGNAPLFSFHSVSDSGPHQSPIRFKAHWKISKGEFFPPLASLLAPENCRYHVASNGSGFTDPVALPLGSPTPLWLTAWAYQPITTPCELSIRDGTAANQILWL